MQHSIYVLNFDLDRAYEDQENVCTGGTGGGGNKHRQYLIILHSVKTFKI